MMREVGTILLEDGAIGVLEAGPGGASLPIVFLHGVGSDKTVWVPQVDHFGASRRAIALDYPGYGESDPRAGIGRDGFANAMLVALDAIGVERFHLCGLSLGGVIAIGMQHLAPSRCASLILADSFAVHPEGRAIYERSVAASISPGMTAMAEARVPHLVGAEADPALRAELAATMSRIDPEAFRQGAEAVWLADQRERAAAIAVPTLVLVGAEDRITPPALSEELAGLIRGAELRVIAGAGHLGNVEQAKRFNGLCSGFLKRVERDS